MPAAARRSRMEWMFVIAGWLYVLFLLYFVFFRHSGYAFDFRGYYEAADEFFHHGINPHTRGWFYASPPMTLNFYRPFLIFTLSQAGLVFMVLKMVGWGFILRLWNRYFLKLDATDPYTLWFFILAFNGAFHYDIISGNVSGFLQMLLWCAFAALLKNRTWIFAVLVIFAAEIKPDLIGFLGLLLFVGKKPQWRTFAASIGIYLLVFGLNHLLYPQLMKDFYDVLLKIGDYNRGVNNPSTLAFLRDYWSHMQNRYSFLPNHVQDGLFIAILIFVFARSYLAFRRYCARVPQIDRRTVILFFCVIFGLLTPRIPPYLYAFMLVPTLYLLRVYGAKMAVPLAAVIVMLPHNDTSFPFAVMITFHWVYIYIQLFGLYLVWYFFLKYLENDAPALQPAEVRA